MNFSSRVMLIAGVLLAAGACSPTTKQTVHDLIAQTGPVSGEVIQRFPPCDPLHASGRRCAPERTAWKIGWSLKSYRVQTKGRDFSVLSITGAQFKRPGEKTWTKVLEEAELNEIFVPYNTGVPRTFDLRLSRSRLMEVANGDHGSGGERLGKFVVKELRDRGLAWKLRDRRCGVAPRLYRGHELVLWSTLEANNYLYLLRYGFRDDGVVTFRLGATGLNYPYPPGPGVPHTHSGLWRIDIDLGTAGSNSAYVLRHIEPCTKGVLCPNPKNQSLARRAFDRPTVLALRGKRELFNGGREGGANWDPNVFSVLNVVNGEIKNRNGLNIGYDVMPIRPGRARHREPWSHYDIWVTQFDGDEVNYVDLPRYIDNEPIRNADIVVWTMTSVHHRPRSEDGLWCTARDKTSCSWWCKPGDQPCVWQQTGAAMTMWSGFDLRPRNFFDANPLYDPVQDCKR